ncbi:MAG: helix-turn-helix transcriptional regulator [Acidobacteria bacterium]|nr:helix-turn-helix transcriptional regulator [Acidobacteriota bacterium]
MLHFSAIGEALRSLRRERGLRQADVAEAAGITSPMLSAYETGKQRPSFATIDKILAALNSDARDLTAALISREEDSFEPSEEVPAHSARTRANHEAVLSVEAQVRSLVEERLEDCSLEERSTLARTAISLLWLLRLLKR